MAGTENQVRRDEGAGATGKVRLAICFINFNMDKEADTLPDGFLNTPSRRAGNVLPVRVIRVCSTQSTSFQRGIHVGRSEQKDIRIGVVMNSRIIGDDGLHRLAPPVVTQDNVPGSGPVGDVTNSYGAGA